MTELLDKNLIKDFYDYVFPDLTLPQEDIKYLLIIHIAAQSSCLEEAFNHQDTKNKHNQKILIKCLKAWCNVLKKYIKFSKKVPFKQNEKYDSLYMSVALIFMNYKSFLKIEGLNPNFVNKVNRIFYKGISLLETFFTVMDGPRVSLMFQSTPDVKKSVMLRNAMSNLGIDDLLDD